MASGWASDSAVQDQIDASVKDAIDHAKNKIPTGNSLTHCMECSALIPEARRMAVPGVRFCIACQSAHDQHDIQFGGYNRRGSKDSQLR